MHQVSTLQKRMDVAPRGLQEQHIYGNSKSKDHFSFPSGPSLTHVEAIFFKACTVPPHTTFMSQVSLAS